MYTAHREGPISRGSLLSGHRDHRRPGIVDPESKSPSIGKRSRRFKTAMGAVSLVNRVKFAVEEKEKANCMHAGCVAVSCWMAKEAIDPENVRGHKNRRLEWFITYEIRMEGVVVVAKISHGGGEEICLPAAPLTVKRIVDPETSEVN